MASRVAVDSEKVPTYVFHSATTVMFAELHWTPGILAQCEDRCHRIGTKGAVQILYCVSQDPALSIDPQLWNMIGRKVGTLGEVVDGDKVGPILCFLLHTLSLHNLSRTSSLIVCPRVRPWMQN